MRKRSAGVMLALVGLLVAGAQHADARTAAVPSAKLPPGKLPPGHSWKVTLLTGDVVRVSTVAGHPPMVTVEPGPGRRNVPFHKEVRPDGTVRVIPLDVAAKIGKVYDPALFDVTTLIREGDDDARRSDLPLIVQSAGKPAASPGIHALTSAGATAIRPLTSIGATAVRQPKTKAPALARNAASGAVRHVWLDRKVHAQALDHNLEQIDAPGAWNAGMTGKGVKVAVLDTGVDATHPDLRGQIAESKSFVPSADTVDRVGHGTHVAATLAGTGAAANGERRGVAPDANLLIGKVLGDDGTGEESGVIAGMEWAAPNARIVSMSLGTDESEEDAMNDPMTKALDELTAKDDTLFVVSAGNSGAFGPDTIDAPAVAAPALTVGAVDGSDHVADFSSRGGTFLKPEISAPGVDIVAARAAGTTLGVPVDALYTSLSGTSMATPHVAGAAADLLQAHPGWSAARLKAALVSTTDAAPGTVYDVGGGRLDVGAAVRATVVGDASTAAFGSVPFTATELVTKSLSWANTGSRPVTLRLTATITDTAGVAHDKALSVPPTVTVPAHGTAAVDLALNPKRLRSRAGRYSGVVTAQAPGVSLRTPVGAFAEPQTHTLTLRATALPGTPDGALAGDAEVVDLDDPTLFAADAEFGADGSAKLQVPSGRYAIFGQVGDTTSGHERSAVVGNPQLTVKSDRTLRLDASHARPVRLSAPGAKLDPDATQGIDLERGLGTVLFDDEIFTFGSSPTIYTTAIGGVSAGTFDTFVLGRLSDGGKTVYDVLHSLGGRVPAEVDYSVDPTRFALIDESFDAINGNTTMVDGPTRIGTTPNGFITNEGVSTVPGGSKRADYVSAEPGIEWFEDTALPGIGFQGTWTSLGFLHEYAPGSTQAKEWGRQPFRPGPSSATSPSLSRCEPGPSVRRSGDIHIELTDLQDRPDGYDCLTDLPDWDAVSSRTMKLYVGGRLAGSTDRQYADFSVPATAGTYRLHYDVDASRTLPISTRTSTDWTFRSSPDVQRLPLLVVDYRLPLDALNHPNGDTATFTVSRVAGAARATATGLKLWTSLDDGATWQQVPVTAAGGTYSARLPHAGKGQFVSLRVHATDSGGSGIDQTIIRAYSGA